MGRGLLSRARFEIWPWFSSSNRSRHPCRPRSAGPSQGARCRSCAEDDRSSKTDRVAHATRKRGARHCEAVRNPSPGLTPTIGAGRSRPQKMITTDRPSARADRWSRLFDRDSKIDATVLAGFALLTVLLTYPIAWHL